METDDIAQPRELDANPELDISLVVAAGTILSPSDSISPIDLVESKEPVIRHVALEAEDNASKRVVDLKARLGRASNHDFWEILLKELCAIANAQCGLVAEKILGDEERGVAQLPELGEPGSYLMGIGCYVDGGKDAREMYHGYKFPAHQTPSACMRDDKVVVIPERLDEAAPGNPGCIPWKKSEAFIGVPLLSEGKCFAHLGLIWNVEGAVKRDLSWNFIEMIMHSLEDMIVQRLFERNPSKSILQQSTQANMAAPTTLAASQSLRPYARSLSHELRTPMQGIVGMLDLMYSTVLDALASENHSRAHFIFKELKHHIEVVQDSSRRAVEAADNVIHAYDLDMQMPESPLSSNLDNEPGQASSLFQLPSPGETVATESDISTPGKRRERDVSEELDYHPGPPLKKMFTMTESEFLGNYYNATPSDATDRSRELGHEGGANTDRTISGDGEAYFSANHNDSLQTSAVMMNNAPQRVILRTFLRTVVHEALQSGHPTSEVHTETDRGETIEVRTEGSRGEIQDRTIHLELDPDVPEVIMTAEQHLQFALQKVVDNAIKFTDEGSITIKVSLSKNSQTAEIRVIDTGRGIPESSKSYLFHPHFQEDPSISRSKDGLGLSLFNAKAHVRKRLGGDMTLERSSTKGPFKGSQFLIRLPISSIDIDGTETPLIGSSPGTPIPHALPSLRPSSLMTVSKSKKRLSFNPNLAKDYPLNFLIAEDNAINRNVAVGSLKKLGYSKDNITVAFDGLEAVRSYKDSLSRPRESRFSGVLMDIWMPKMDGYEAAEKILNIGRENGETTKVIAVTADITGQSAEKAREVGMHGFLAKPYKVNDIERMIIQNFPRACSV
ncbi:HHK17, histidine kinase-group VII protein [Xylogone sp. PMI_703]|nr:HHK17, histidine kinase-group VII protein [Xylogone sp. PMI_703]